MRRSPWILPLLCAFVAPLAHGRASSPSRPLDEPDPRALFLEHCARCHGETGDGKGVTELDRPARSFKDGGFSFGNTPEALFRTLSTGIPGTPMPGFDSAIDEDGLRALAVYVRSLGPPIEETDTSDAVLEVSDEPLFIRGHLPPITEGAPSHPRGLLVGTTSGLTFEYQLDDVRLLGVRQGPFVAREDWTGRGGTPLKPLGPVIHTQHGGTPGPVFRLSAGSDERTLEARLRSTWVRNGEAGLTFDLMDDRRVRRARLEERVRAVTTPMAAGFEREFHVDASAPDGSNPWSIECDLIAPIGDPLAWDPGPTGDGRQVHVFRSEEGLVQVVSLLGAEPVREGLVTIPGGSNRRVVVTTRLCSQWDDETQSIVRAQVAR